MKAWTGSLTALGLVFFVRFSPIGQTFVAWNWVLVANVIGTVLPILTLAASSVTVIHLAYLLKFAQRVLPFMSVKLLLTALLLAILAFVTIAIQNFPPFLTLVASLGDEGDAINVALIWVQLLSLGGSNFLLLYLFHGAPLERSDDTRQLITAAEEPE